jgi:hypothetical protein
MARANAALAVGSRIPGVLLRGMPGGGKTACALELAYTHEHAFDRLVWFKAPDEGQDILGALADFALTLENELPGFQMAHLLADKDKLTAFLPRLTELAERRRVLIVIDNLESLLTESGQWRDDRWGKVVTALCAHRGLGRLIVTSRRMPSGAGGVAGSAGGARSAVTTGPGAATGSGVAADLMGTGILRVLAVDALSAEEALLLSRELPHLDRLIRGELPGVDREVARRLALGVLTIAQGHPKLLELADGQAGDPQRLTVLVAVGDQAWREQGGLPDGFFAISQPVAQSTKGQSTTAQFADGASVDRQSAPDQSDTVQREVGQPAASAVDYLHVLGAWTRVVSETLTVGERTLFWFLCCLEEADRERHVLDGNWADLWTRLGRDGQPPVLDRALTGIAARGLAAVRAEVGEASESYAVHPGVAAAGRTQAGEEFRDSVDAEAAAYWDAVYKYASGKTGDGTVRTGLLVRAGLAAVPYLIRRRHWTAAATMLEGAFNRDPSRANAAAVLPAIEEIAGSDLMWGGVLARVLSVLDPAAGERQMRGYLDAAVARGDYLRASVAAGGLVNLCWEGGRLPEALTIAEQLIGYTRQAGLGPWTQLADEVQRLQVLAAMGQADRVLADVQRLRDRMRALPAAPGPDETVTPWDVREALLDTGREAAAQLGRWQDAFDLSAEQIASKRGRSAPAAAIARSRANDYYPLLMLGRVEEALALLLECRQAFQDARDPEMLGKTIGALAGIEGARGHGDAAIALARDALRYKYLAGDVIAIAVSYHNLGSYLAVHARQPAPALACHLAAALIRALTGAGGSDDSVRAAAIDLRTLGTQDAEGPVRAASTGIGEPGTEAAPPPGAVSRAEVRIPTDASALCLLVGDIPGTDLPRLLATLAPDPATADQALRELAAQAKAQAAAPPESTAPASPA